MRDDIDWEERIENYDEDLEDRRIMTEEEEQWHIDNQMRLKDMDESLREFSSLVEDL